MYIIIYVMRRLHP